MQPAAGTATAHVVNWAFSNLCLHPSFEQHDCRGGRAMRYARIFTATDNPNSLGPAFAGLPQAVSHFEILHSSKRPPPRSPLSLSSDRCDLGIGRLAPASKPG